MAQLRNFKRPKGRPRKPTSQTARTNRQTRSLSKICTFDESAEHLNRSQRTTGILKNRDYSHARRRLNDDIIYYRIADVAERLRVSERTVRRWIDAGLLIAHRVGGIVLIAEADLRAFLALHRKG